MQLATLLENSLASKPADGQLQAYLAEALLLCTSAIVRIQSACNDKLSAPAAVAVWRFQATLLLLQAPDPAAMVRPLLFVLLFVNECVCAGCCHRIS